MNEEEQITFNLSPRLKRMFKMKTIANDTTMSTVLRNLIKRYIKEEGDKSVEENKKKRILKIIEKINSSDTFLNDEDGAPLSNILLRAANYGIPEDEVKKILKRLKERGHVYCPEENYYKVKGSS